MQIEKGGMFQERCGRIYFFMFNTQIKYIYIERMKLKCHDETNLVPLSYARYLMCERKVHFDWWA